MSHHQATNDLLLKVTQYATAVPTHDSTGYAIPPTPLGSRRPLRIIIIGFGAAGINLAHILSHQTHKNTSIQCYDKNPEVGGTWFENRYPGCACDIPAVNYQFSWAVKDDWKAFYAGAEEILGYFRDVVEVDDLGRFVKLDHWVQGARWDEEGGKWRVEVWPAGREEEVFYDEADVLINATGVLNHWKWPDVPGLERFGNKVHTASWDSEIELEDKVVGVVGNGSSAVQIIPAIFPKVREVKTFIRSSTWITAGFAQRYAGENGANFEYTEEQKQKFRDDPAEYLQYRKMVEQELNQRFKFIINGSEAQKEALVFAHAEMARKLNGREDLILKLVPTDYAVGCRRPTPGNGYLECLTDEKCSVSFERITEATAKGLVTEDGVHHDMDLLICATGFDVSFKPKFPIVGKGGLDLKDAWAKQPDTYLSATIPQFPNYFMINGPFGPYGHGSILPIIEVITRYIEKFITKLARENIKSFYPKQEAVDEFRRHRELFLLRTAWSSPCRSWFKGGTVDGPIMMWPGSRLHFFEALAEPRYEDYEWEYQLNNRFSYFGNGFSQREVDGDDLSWYIDGI
ncbi:hypothetical protein BDV12DRAFT_211233 [Aspergillus spectabilis]